MKACIYNHFEIIDFLLSNGANIHEMNNNGETCFSRALQFKRFNILYRLRKWPTTMAILVLQELNLFAALCDPYHYIGTELFSLDNEKDYELVEE